MKPLERGEIETLKAQATGARVAGKHRSIEAGALRRGQWTKLKSGAGVWRLAIQSPGAAGLRVHFAGFDAGAGKVWVYSETAPGKPEIAGPYSGKGPNHDGAFWSDAVFAAGIVVEFQPPATARNLPFRILEISHLFE
ncbi:MAG: hypothetical protein HY822_09860 [Acidobacteria bacterium]|nr:hypothetical protein [Acidobacteriota bacterium]